jgi:hypothetical protein
MMYYSLLGALSMIASVLLLALSWTERTRLTRAIPLALSALVVTGVWKYLAFTVDVASMVRWVFVILIAVTAMGALAFAASWALDHRASAQYAEADILDESTRADRRAQRRDERLAQWSRWAFIGAAVVSLLALMYGVAIHRIPVHVLIQ